jgi:formiminotetrahydrofolate cyclodeaminase
MSDWFEREEERLVDAVNDGEISEQDFRKEMRYLRDELQRQAEEAAERAYDDVMGGGW